MRHLTTILGLATILTLGCAPDDGPRKKRPATGTPTGTTLTTGTPTTGLTTGTPTPTAFDCSAPFLAPPLDITSYGIRTQEDFDFSSGGYLIYQSDIAVIGTDKQANETVLSAGEAGDPRGIHGLSDGRIVIMSPWDGSIKIADPSTGGVVVLTSSLNTPNGVDIGADDRIYFTSYGEVGWLDVDGTNHQVIHNWSGGVTTPNGTALSEDENTLYVAAPKNNNQTEFWTFDRLGPDDWGSGQILHTVNGFFSALDVDICGNLYTVDYSGGDVYRITPAGTAERIAQLTGSGGWGFSALRFGPGHSDWEADHLYVSHRNTAVYDITVGVPGRTHPTLVMP